MQAIYGENYKSLLKDVKETWINQELYYAMMLDLISKMSVLI